VRGFMLWLHEIPRPRRGSSAPNVHFAIPRDLPSTIVPELSAQSALASRKRTACRCGGSAGLLREELRHGGSDRTAASVIERLQRIPWSSLIAYVFPRAPLLAERPPNGKVGYSAHHQ
jgi:hypothetical protein